MKIGKIEKGVPIPEKYRGGKFIGFMREMEIGDSILLQPDSTVDLDHMSKSFYAYAAKMSHTWERRFTGHIMRTEPGFRVWRIK